MSDNRFNVYDVVYLIRPCEWDADKLIRYGGELSEGEEYKVTAVLNMRPSGGINYGLEPLDPGDRIQVDERYVESSPSAWNDRDREVVKVAMAISLQAYLIRDLTDGLRNANANIDLLNTLLGSMLGS